MKTIYRTVLMLLIATLLFACATTSLVNVWTNPDFSGNEYKRVAILALFSETGKKQIIEQTLVAQFKRNGVDAINLSNVASFTSKTTKEEIAATLKAQNCDAIITLKPIGVDKSYDVSSTGVAIGGFYPGFYGYYNSYWSGPTTITENKTYNIENNLYDVNENALVWSGKSESFDPSSAENMATGIGTQLLLSLDKAGLISVTKK